MCLYSDILLEEIFSDLKIEKKEDQIIFGEALEDAAQSFLNSENSAKNRLSLGKENKKLQQLENSLKKAKEAYSDLSETSKGSIFRFLSGLKNSKTKNKFEKEMLLNLTDRNGILYSHHIQNILETLEKSAHQAQEEQYVLSKMNKTNLVLFWLWEFSDEWNKYSSIKISEGRYDEAEQKYVSPAMRILDKMAAPLNISNSKIAEAIKLFRQQE